MKNLKLKDGTFLEFNKTEIMGIININDNSFYEGSRVNEDNLLLKAQEMINEGAVVLDIGAESTRPGSEPMDEEEEKKRVEKAVKLIRSEFKDILISIDSYRTKTARAALESGADIINDISGLNFDEDMVKVIAEFKVPVIIMHIKGRPKDMQLNPHYDNLIEEMKEFFERSIEKALKAGVDRRSIMLDPGIGFGKTFEHNIEIIRNIDFMKEYKMPILLAVSRKSFIGEILDKAPANERLEGTLAVSAYACMKNIEMLRVHDVKENVRLLKVMEYLK